MVMHEKSVLFGFTRNNPNVECDDGDGNDNVENDSDDDGVNDSDNNGKITNTEGLFLVTLKSMDFRRKFFFYRDP